MNDPGTIRSAVLPPIAVLGSIILLWVTGCGIQIKPLPSLLANQHGSVDSSRADPRVVFRFFDEDFVSGGYSYNYPEDSKVLIPEESGKDSEVSVLFDLVPADYSGGAVCLYNLLYDMRPYYQTGALQFWVKGEKGGEIAWVAFADDEPSDGKKTVVRLPLNKYGGIDSTWRLVSIPLADFGKKGVYWDAKKRLEVPQLLDWRSVAEFRFEIKKGDNKNFRVWVDDIFVLRDVYESSKESQQELWEERHEFIPPVPQTPPVVIHTELFKNDASAVYVYGGKTSYALKMDSSDKNTVLAGYLDNDDYSGVTLVLGNGEKVDFEPLRKKKAAGIAFWARSPVPLKGVFLGVIDVENDDLKIQSKIAVNDFGAIDSTWRYFMIPVRMFLDKGKSWDAGKQAEIVSDMNWRNIGEFRFSINKGENRLAAGEPVVLFVDDMTIIDEIPGYVDPQLYWAAFSSNEPDVMLHDIESPIDQTWDATAGEKSELKAEIVPADSSIRGKNSLKISYRLADYCDAMYEYPAHGIGPEKRDWSKHWGLKFDFYTNKPYQPISVQVNDAGNEIFIIGTGGPRGWTTVLVPFKDFAKFPYWQPPDAQQNGKFNLESVIKIDFKPAGEGSSGSFKIDNVVLTNVREIQQPKAPESVAVILKGNLEKVVTDSINGGIFGINAAVWDGDLLRDETAKHVKAVNHGVIRYPGGLRADEDHWEAVLKKKDWMADTDEFLEFCAKTGTEPMITVNFGTGTPQEAAAWVKHCNITRKANVRYWEIGNELYGDWHPNHCTGEEYGKRTAEFIKTMKSVDPSIIVAVVWVLEGAWNREVFEHTKDIADAVCVHHYSQHTGEENDAGLLAAPQGLPQIMNSVKNQLAAFGIPDKSYEIWLTEWNSVDFKPGPQTLSPVNALFVADYLGMLAHLDIEQASYWDIHNDITEQGGDYGYLSRTGAPDGDNVPRPSYQAFRLASASLRGSLSEVATDNDNVSAYLAKNGSVSRLMVINKLPQSKAQVTVNIDGFGGTGTLLQLAGQGWHSNPASSPVRIKTGSVLELEPYSISVVEMPTR